MNVRAHNIRYFYFKNLNFELFDAASLEIHGANALLIASPGFMVDKQ